MNKVKKIIKNRWTLPVLSVVAVIAIEIYLHHQSDDEGWDAYVLNQEQRDILAANSDAVVAFEPEKVMILGQPWNPTN